MKVLFVTGNKNKLAEAQAIIPEIQSIDIDLDEIQHTNPEIVVEDKARRAYEKTQQPVVVEDVSLIIDSWNGFPGALIKWAINTMGVKKLSELAQGEQTTITCVIGYYNGTHFKTFSATTKGTITSPRGENGFGFDSIVEMDNKTIAERTPQEKNAMSMRAQAFNKLKDFLEKETL